MTGQISREQALSILENPPYTEVQLKLDKQYIADKLDISVEELMYYHQLPLKSFRDYNNESFIFDLGAWFLKSIGVEQAIKR